MEEPTGQPSPAGGEPGQPSSGQPPKDPAADPGEPTGDQLITLPNGQQVTAEKLIKMNADAQSEISRLQAKKVEPTAEPSQEEADKLKEAQDLVTVLMPALEKAGFAKQDSVDALVGDQKLDRFVVDNPELAKHKTLLKDLSKDNPEMSHADLVAKYSLGKVQDPSQPSGDVVGEPNKPTDESVDLNNLDKTMEQLDKVETAEDLEKFEEKVGLGNSKRFEKEKQKKA